MVVVVQVQIDRQTVQARLAGIPHAVVIQVVPLVAADVRLEVAEVRRLGHAPTAYGPQPGRRIDRDHVLPRRPDRIEFIGIALLPAVRQYFPNRVGSGRQVREPEGSVMLAIVSRPKRRLAGTELVIVVQIQVDRPAVQAWLAGVPHAVVIQVVPLVAADVRLEIPKVRRLRVAKPAARAYRHHVLVTDRIGIALLPILRQLLTHHIGLRPVQIGKPKCPIVLAVETRDK